MNRLALFIVVSFWGKIAFPQEHAADVEDLKIAFVYNFSKYTSWPASVFASSEDVNFCIAGSPGLLAKFDILNGQLTNHKTIHVVAMQLPERAIQTCHVLYVAADYAIDTRELLASFGSKPLLTIGDRRGFSDHGGMIELMEIDHKITFRINNAQAQANNIAISSMLLRLAQ